MSQATPQLRDFATRLMSYEAVGKVLNGTRIPAGFYVSEKLRLHLATFMGRTGFHTLLARSLALSAAEVPWLSKVRVEEDGSLGGLEGLQAELGPDEFFEGGVVLLAQLLGLLVSFIGERLTLRLVLEVWPKVPLNGFDFSIGGTHENSE